MIGVILMCFTKLDCSATGVKLFIQNRRMYGVIGALFKGELQGAVVLAG
jgi:hypothetical protein